MGGRKTSCQICYAWSYAPLCKKHRMLFYKYKGHSVNSVIECYLIRIEEQKEFLYDYYDDHDFKHFISFSRFIANDSELNRLYEEADALLAFKKHNEIIGK